MVFWQQTIELNDLDGNVFNFRHAIQYTGRSGQIMRRVKAMPFSRLEFGTT